MDTSTLQVGHSLAEEWILVTKVPGVARSRPVNCRVKSAITRKTFEFDACSNSLMNFIVLLPVLV